MRRRVRKLLRAPWPCRALADLVAVVLLALLLPKLGGRTWLGTWMGFAALMLATVAMLLLASWAAIPPAARTVARFPIQIAPGDRARD